MKIYVVVYNKVNKFVERKMNLETCAQLLIKVNKYADSEFRIKKSRKRKREQRTYYLPNIKNMGSWVLKIMRKMQGFRGNKISIPIPIPFSQDGMGMGFSQISQSI